MQMADASLMFMQGARMKTSFVPWLAILLLLKTSCGQTPLSLSGSRQTGSAGAGGAATQGGSGGVVVGTGGVLGAGGVFGTGGVVGAGRVTGTGGGTTVGHYVVSADGLTVTDTSTGLVWQRDGSGLRPICFLTPYCTWAEAQSYCAGLTLDGSGWRLPTVTELQSIVDSTVASPPVINQKAFPNTPPDYFWTSSLYAGSSDYAWYLNFADGRSFSNGVGSSERVRCVR